MRTRVEKALQNRWVATAATIAIGCIALWMVVDVIERAYYDYYFYPRMKGAEYTYPELRYTFGQAATLLWSVVGLCTAALAGRCALFRKGANLVARCLMALAVGFFLLVVGFVAGMAMRDFVF